MEGRDRGQGVKMEEVRIALDVGCLAVHLPLSQCATRDGRLNFQTRTEEVSRSGSLLPKTW